MITVYQAMSNAATSFYKHNCSIYYTLSDTGHWMNTHTMHCFAWCRWACSLTLNIIECWFYVHFHKYYISYNTDFVFTSAILFSGHLYEHHDGAAVVLYCTVIHWRMEEHMHVSYHPQVLKPISCSINSLHVAVFLSLNKSPAWRSKLLF